MREIKFRAWHSVNEVMYDHKSIPVLAKNIQSDNIWTYLQYTGLKDKSGIEVFDGDIVEVFGKGSYNGKYAVKWDETTLSFVLIYCRWIFEFNRHNKTGKLGGGFLRLTAQIKCFILGNIYQHPHLLNDAK